jgi:hypothetical protein
MAGDLPDYTRLFTVNISLAENLRVFATKAEALAKKSKYAHGNIGVTLDLDPPAKGDKTGLLLVVASTNNTGDYLSISTLQSSVLTKVLDYVYLTANVPVILVFPCWIPTQDLGNGTDANISINIASSVCDSAQTLFALYYEETPA